jgi:glycosyltransferase involved in cell wall biosynthesis
MQYPKSVSIIIPAYNEQATIVKVLEEIKAYTAARREIEWEIIVVNDASKDETSRLAGEVAGIHLINHPLNRGYGASLKTGIRAAQGEYVLTMDADGQHVAEEIDNMLPQAQDYDMTIGKRDFSSSPALRRPGKVVLNLLARYLLRETIPDVNSGLRLMRRSAILPYLSLCSDRFSFSLSSTMALVSEGYFVRFVPIATRNRQGNQSQVKLSSGLAAMLMIIRSTVIFHPLRIFLPISLFFGAIFLVSFVMDLFQNNVSKSSLALLVLTANLLLAGFLSDQIARVRRSLFWK